MRLHRSGESVRALVRERSSRARLSGFEGAIVEGDLLDADSLLRACSGVDRVVHCAAAFRKEGVGLASFDRVNVDGSLSLVKAAQEAGARRFVHVSTVGVHGEIESPPADEEAPFKPEDHYQSSKLRGEVEVREALESAGIEGVVVRPVGIYGPGDTRFLKLFRQVARGRFPRIGDGRTLYHLTYIEDLTDGVVRCLDHAAAPGETFILGGPEVVTIDELIDLVAETVGARPPRVRLPEGPVKWLAFSVEHCCRLLRVEPPIYRRRLDFFLKDRAFDISKARSVLGFEPRVGVREGLALTVEHYVRQGVLDPPVGVCGPSLSSQVSSTREGSKR